MVLVARSYDVWKQRPHKVVMKHPTNGLVSRYYVDGKKPFEGEVVATHCARLFCGHLWHGEVCTECVKSLAQHRPKEYPGQREEELY